MDFLISRSNEFEIEKKQANYFEDSNFLKFNERCNRVFSRLVIVRLTDRLFSITKNDVKISEEEIIPNSYIVRCKNLQNLLDISRLS